jgi:hypothetical protein
LNSLAALPVHRNWSVRFTPMTVLHYGVALQPRIAGDHMPRPETIDRPREHGQHRVSLADVAKAQALKCCKSLELTSVLTSNVTKSPRPSRTLHAAYHRRRGQRLMLCWAQLCTNHHAAILQCDPGAAMVNPSRPC